MRNKADPTRKPQGKWKVISVSISMEEELRNQVIRYTEDKDITLSQLTRQLLREAIANDKQYRTKRDQ